MFAWPDGRENADTFEALLEILNTSELASVWSEDETIGWVYQFFNSREERQALTEVVGAVSEPGRTPRP